MYEQSEVRAVENDWRCEIVLAESHSIIGVAFFLPDCASVGSVWRISCFGGWLLGLWHSPVASAVSCLLSTRNKPAVESLCILRRRNDWNYCQNRVNINTRWKCRITVPECRNFVKGADSAFCAIMGVWLSCCLKRLVRAEYSPIP